MIYQFGSLCTESDGAFHLAGAQAARADVDMLPLAVDDRAYTLNIRLPLALRLQMRVADIHAGHLALCTDFTNTCHGVHLLRGAVKESLINSAPPSWRIFSALSVSTNPPHSTTMRPVRLLDRTKNLRQSDGLHFISAS